MQPDLILLLCPITTPKVPSIIYSVTDYYPPQTATGSNPIGIFSKGNANTNPNGSEIQRILSGPNQGTMANQPTQNHKIFGPQQNYGNQPNMFSSQIQNKTGFNNNAIFSANAQGNSHQPAWKEL